MLFPLAESFVLYFLFRAPTMPLISPLSSLPIASLLLALALSPVAFVLVDPGFVLQFCFASIIALVPVAGQGFVLAVDPEHFPRRLLTPYSVLLIVRVLLSNTLSSL